MTAPVDLTAVKAMLFYALTNAATYTDPVGGVDHVYLCRDNDDDHLFIEPAERFCADDWDTSNPAIKVRACIDPDKLAATVAEWFAAREGGR